MVFRFPDKPTACGPEFASRIEREEPGQWLAQPKYDDWRCVIATKKNEECTLHTRLGTEFKNIPTLPSAIRNNIAQIHRKINSLSLPPNTVLDSALVGPRGGQAFHVYVFDCLAWNGKWMNDTPFSHRWRKCLSIFQHTEKNALISPAKTIDTGFLALFTTLKEQWIQGGCDLSDCEGIILKRCTGTLVLHFSRSTRSKHLFKLKFRDIRDRRF